MTRAPGVHVSATRDLSDVPICWMCDTLASPRASEHVFPHWLLARIPGRTIAVDEICATCNSGWMSGLEVVFRAAFRRPRTGVISASTQLILARWFAKTAVLIEVAETGATVTPPAARHGLKTGLPHAYEVYLARHRGRMKR